MLKSKKLLFSLLIVSLLASIFAWGGFGMAETGAEGPVVSPNLLASRPDEQQIRMVSNPDKDQDHKHEVIIKWHEGSEAPKIPGTVLLAQDLESRVAKLAVISSKSVEEIISLADDYPDLEYIQPNYRYRIQALPNDIEYRQQWHHGRVNLPQAWDITDSNQGITIAVLDTGVDLTHPDLRANLISGYNMINPDQSVQDDYGHGTQVAGILAAVGNNANQGTGVLWRARIMPVKVLDGRGEGDDYDIARGINQAVRAGAKIIVLSLGDRLYSQHMEDAVNNAEKNNVLLVAATGNNGSTVNYPAAFSTVLAVGASDQNDRVPSYSNYGPEIDVVAPGQSIYTTSLGGKMTYNSGTSMAAPIVAGVAALIYDIYPDMEAWQVRQLLKQTAKDIENPAWDQASGWGRIDAYQALTQVPKVNIWAPNSTMNQAKILPRSTLVQSELAGVNDAQWFYIDISNRGRAELTFASEVKGLAMSWYLQDSQNPATLYPLIYSKDRVLEPGRYYVRLAVNNLNQTLADLQAHGVHPGSYTNVGIAYSLSYNYRIAADIWEVNDTINQAANLDLYQLTIDQMQENRPYIKVEGSLHKNRDYDWYSLSLPYPGLLSIEVVNSYGRFDPVLTISEFYSSDRTAYKLTDANPHGMGEFWQGNLESGDFYFMIADYQLRAQPHPYELRIYYAPVFEDRQEPNDNRNDASGIMLEEGLHGFLDGNKDQDWFFFRLDGTEDIQLELTAALAKGLIAGASIEMDLFAFNQERALESIRLTGASQAVIETRLNPGVYYVKLGRAGLEMANNRQLPYQLALRAIDLGPAETAEEISDIYSDVRGEDLVNATNFLHENMIVRGFPDGTFQPDKSLTRAEVVSLALRILRGDAHVNIEADRLAELGLVYHDLTEDHWAYVELLEASDMGLILGYGDGTMRPNEAISRGQLATILGRAFRIQMESLIPKVNQLTINDLGQGHWAYEYVEKSLKLGLFDLDAKGNFRPDQASNRGEAALALYRIFSQIK